METARELRGVANVISRAAIEAAGISGGWVRIDTTHGTAAIMVMDGDKIVSIHTYDFYSSIALEIFGATLEHVDNDGNLRK